MDEATKQQLIAAGREDLVEAHEITVSGYAGVMPHNGMIVDRRKHPEAIPARKNTALGIPEPKELPNNMKYKIKNDIIAKRAEEYAKKSSKSRREYMEIRSSFRAGMFEALKILNENIRESEEPFCVGCAHKGTAMHEEPCYTCHYWNIESKNG